MKFSLRLLFSFIITWAVANVACPHKSTSIVGVKKRITFEFKFINAGIYTYRCNLHSGMIGKISVFTENGLLVDPTPTPSPTSTPRNSNQSDQISPPQSNYY